MPSILLSLILLTPADADAVPAPGSGLEPPRQIAAHGAPIDIGREGQACPLFADLDGDGLGDLLVGEAWGGRLRVYRNLGTQQSPKFGDYEWLRAGDDVARVPWALGGYKGFTPQLVDLDADGRLDIVSGCYDAPANWTNEFDWFRRREDGTFAEAVKLVGEDEQPVQLTGGAQPACADWDGDGDIDLVIGKLDGNIQILRNKGTPTDPRFAEPTPLMSAGQPIKAASQWAHPCVADWDGDGDLDLLVAALDGSVKWYPNRRTAEDPQLNGFLALVRPSPVTVQPDSHRPQGHPGMQPAVCVADYNGDGRVDLLLGDGCGRFRGDPPQQPHERRDAQASRDRLAELRGEWAAAFRAFQAQTATAADAASAADSRTTAELKQAMEALNEQIEAAQMDVEYYRPRNQMHGFVWVFLRKPSDD